MDSDLTGRKIIKKKRVELRVESGEPNQKRFRMNLENLRKNILQAVAMQKDNQPIYEDKTNLLIQIITEF